MDRNTIMPDGRPLHAWESEIAINRSERSELHAEKRQVRNLLAALDAAEISMRDEPHSDDIVIRIRRHELMRTTNPERLIAEAKVERVAPNTL